LGFVLLSTGLKLQTHEHLQNLKQFETTRMMESLVQIHEAFKNIDEKQLLLGLEEFRSELERQNLVSLETSKKIKSLRHPAIEFAKGCGALGADVILLIYSLAQKQSLLEYLRQAQYHLVATESDLAPGLSVKVNP
jgi:NAD-dependent DNA ligase